MRFLARGTLDVIGPIPLCPKTNVTVSTKTMLKKRCRTVRMQTPFILCLRLGDGLGLRVAGAEETLSWLGFSDVSEWLKSREFGPGQWRC